MALLQKCAAREKRQKDIIKIPGDISGLNFDVLGYVDPQDQLTFIENGHVARKVRPDQPKRLVNVIKCTNPRCITSLGQSCDHILPDPSGRYRCVTVSRSSRYARKGSAAFSILFPIISSDPA